MAVRSYWLDLFTGKTWQEFLDAGGEVSGYRKSRWNSVQKIKTGDFLLCYLTGVSRWIGVLEVVSKPFQDSSPIWKDEDFSSRVRVKSVVTLIPETAVPIFELKEQLSIFRNLKSPHAWTGRLRGSPARWSSEDGEAITKALLEAVKNPVLRSVDPAKLARRPQALKAKIGSVTVPEIESPEEEQAKQPESPHAHAEIQWLLLKLGSELGLDVWVARNDKNREVNGQKFSDISALRSSLPLQFDDATNKTIELIDVLWLKGNAIIAAFEIESTTSIYSGLLRMADLISMQPNLKIPLYLVGPDERREKVIAEVNRPTFSRLSPPMVEMCRFIPFSALRDGCKKAQPLIRHLKPEYIEELSESCEAEELE